MCEQKWGFVTLEDLPERRTFITVFGHINRRCNGEGPCQGASKQNDDQRPRAVHDKELVGPGKGFGRTENREHTPCNVVLDAMDLGYR